MATECTCQSEHTVQVVGGQPPLSYTWSADNGATIVSGQGTDTVTVETTSCCDVTFTLTCNVTDAGTGDDTMNKSVTHTHTGHCVKTCDVLSDGSNLVLYLFNNNADDKCGTYNGTWTGTPQYDITDCTRMAVFDGSSSYISLPNDAAFRTNTCTVSFWLNAASTSEIQTIFCNNEESHASGNYDNSGFYISIDDSNNIICCHQVRNDETYTDDLGNTFTAYSIKSVTPFTPNTDIHVIATFNENESTIYLNGEKKNHVQSSQSFGYPRANGAHIGARVQPSIYLGQFFGGEVGHFRFLNKTITDQEVVDIYNDAKNAR